MPESFAQIAASAGAVPVVYRCVLPDEEAGQRWPAVPDSGSVSPDTAVTVLTG